MLPTIRKFMQVTKLARISYVPQMNFANIKAEEPPKHPFDSASFKTPAGVDNPAASTLGGDFNRNHDTVTQESVQKKQIHQENDANNLQFVASKQATTHFKNEMPGKDSISRKMVDNANAGEAVRSQMNAENKSFGLTHPTDPTAAANRGTYLHPADPKSSPEPDTMSYINETHKGFPRDHDLGEPREDPYAQKIREQRLSSDNWATISDSRIEELDNKTGPKDLHKVTEDQLNKGLNAGKVKVPFEEPIGLNQKRTYQHEDYKPKDALRSDPLDPIPPNTKRDAERAKNREHISAMDRKQFEDLTSEPLHKGDKPKEINITDTVNRKIKKH